MTNFMFRFGYCPPNLWKQNESHGWDDEDSSAFLVAAPTSAEALWWGGEVADAFARHLFHTAGWINPPSWKESGFSHWIEENPEQSFDPTSIAQLRKVTHKEMPDFEGW